MENEDIHKIEAIDKREKGSKFTEWPNEPTVEKLKSDYLNAAPDRDNRIDRIDQWLDNLHGTGTAARKKTTGKSSLQPKLIRKHAEWRYASLSEPFLDNVDIYDVLPVTYEDKEAAIQNGLVLNHQFSNHIRKNEFIDEYIRTAVDEGTVIVRVGWEFSEKEVEVPNFMIYPTQSPEVIQQLQYIQGKLQEDPKYLATLNPEVQEAYELSVESGIPREVREEGTRMELQTIKNCPTLEVVNYNNITIDPTANGSLSKAKFVIHSYESSLAELKKEGKKYRNLKQIDVESNTVLAEPDHRNDDESNFNFEDKNRKRFVVYEYWGYWDINDTGILEPIVATYVGNVMIRLEKSPFPDGQLPFVSAQYLPVRRSVYGEPDGELLKENQDVIGALTRGMIDIMARSANGQMGRRKDALDVVNRRRFERGEDYEFNPGMSPQEAFFTHTWSEIPRSAEFMLGLQNGDAEALTGVRAFSQSSSGNIGSSTAAGVRSATDAASKRELGILRRLGEGIKDIGRKIIAMNSKFLDENEIIRITNDEFVPVRRDDLAGKFDLRLTISTAESDSAKAEELAFMLQTTGQTMGPEFSQIILADIARLRKMPDLAKRIEEYQPQPDPLAQAKAELEIKLLEAQIYNETAKGHENNANAALDNAKARNLDSDSDQKDLQYLEDESGISHERDLEKQGAQARANILLENQKHVNTLEKERIGKDTKSDQS